MEQIAYTSRASEAVTATELFKIIEVSARNNPGREVTGFLIATQGEFFQLVEGPSQRLDELMRNLEGDDRHRNIRLLLRENVQERQFPNWRMKRFDATRADPQQVLVELRKIRVRQSVLSSIESFLVAPLKAA